MTQIQRNFYDMTRSKNVPKYGLEIIDGYTTAIGIHEMKLLLCAEVSHKLIHTRTIYDEMNDLYEKSSTNFKALFQENLVGQIIMTK